VTQTLKKTLIVRLSLVVICVNILVSLVFYGFSVRLAENEFLSASQRETESLADSFTQQLWLFDENAVEQLANMAFENPDISALRLLDQNNAVLIEKGSADNTGITEMSQSLVHSSGVQVGTLVVSYRDSSRKTLTNLIAKISILTILATIIVSLGLITLLLRKHLLKPLALLQEDMNRVAAGEFKKSSLIDQKQEIQSIVDVFNQMAASLEAREIQQAQLESEVRQKHKMEAVGLLAGGMAHNFNNNLAIILGNLELAQIKAPPEAAIGEYLSQAKIALMRSRELICQIMTYSRNEVRSLEAVSAAGLVVETAKLLSLTIPSSIDFQQHISDKAMELKIEADATRVQEALINLCNNSVQAMGEKGSLTIRLDECSVEQTEIPEQFSAAAGNFVRIQVADTGCGIPEALQEKIFDPFFTTKEVNEGTGMGLSTVRGIIEQHNGFITVNSQLDKGTVISLYFPLAGRTMVAREAEEFELLRGSEKILYVDDEEMLQKMAVETLKSLGYQVTGTTDAQAAMELLKNNAADFDLVITDQIMPGMTGTELIQELKKIRPDLPTILCTGYSSEIRQDDAERIGVAAFCYKPLEMKVLAKTVRDCLD
jgi:signal transduction histidine kinase/CheY-like chemotaxis protein